MARCIWIAFALCMLCACYEDETRFRSDTGEVPAREQRPGDPARGFAALMNEPYVSCGMPRRAFDRLGQGEIVEALDGRSPENAELPHALTQYIGDDGVERVTSNCLTCHAAELNGEIVVGLGNEFADFTGDPRRTVLRSGNFVQGAAETAAWKEWADRIEGIGPYTQTKTIGVNPATNLTWALMAHINPETLKWSNDPLIDPPPTDPLPISVPPWWGMAKKNAMFYTTIGRGDHSLFMLMASMLCIDGQDDLEEIAEYAPDIRAYIASLEAPVWPWDIDAELAEEGRALYQRDCRECHGTYGGLETYPNLVVSVEDVGTDPHYAVEATNGARDRFYEWVARSPYGGDAQSAAPARGYIAPPLDGIWATAPYLHNGSVPSLEALLDSKLRPQFWRHELPKKFNAQSVGWEFEVLPAGQSEESDPAERKRIYDTQLRGYSNSGHTYSDALNDDERRALLEYLKTL